jgi:hypothetical protein
MKVLLLTVFLCVVLVCPVVAQTSTPSPSPSPSPSGSTELAAKVSDEPAAKATKPPLKTAKGTIALPPEKAQPFKVPRFEKAPTIDGKLDDEVWKTAIVLKDFYQTQPGDNIPPSKETRVYIGYDPKFIYLGFHCFDEPGKVRANIPKRDNIWDDDYVGILFDTFNDQRKAYEFDFNPLGIQADGIWTDGQGEDFSLDIIMDSKGEVTEDGYTIEVAIPFKSLRYVAGKDKLWGVHFWRRIKRLNNELDMWMPISRDISSWLAQAGKMTGLEGIATERTLDLIPSLTLSETGKRKAPVTLAEIANGGRFVNEPIKFDPGLTGKFSPKPTMTLDFAINPDFAQVESDQLVVTANQRFPIFFPEKRPFFLEGIDIFQTQIAAVHTRTIVDPDAAVKLTGKSGRNTYGLLVASDNAPGNFSEEELPNAPVRLVGKNAQVGILRLKRDIGKSDSYLGFLGTYRRFVDVYNDLGGVDGRFRFDKITTFSFQVLGTYSRNSFFYPNEGGSFDRKEPGLAYATSLDKDGRHWGWNFSTVGRSRYFRSDVGFSRRTNTNNFNYFLRYNSEPKPKAKLISWRVYNAFGGNYDWQGRSQNFNNESQIQFSLRRQTFFGFGWDQGYERLFEEEFGPNRQSVDCVVHNNCTFFGFDSERSTPNHGIYAFMGSAPSKKYNFNVFVNRVWNSFDFDFGALPKYPRVSPPAIAAQNARAAGLCGGPTPLPVCNSPQDPGPGDFWHFDGSLTYQPTAALNASLSFTKERLRRYDTDRVAFDENIVSLRTTYQFTRFLFARGRIDYESIQSNWKGQFLLGWTPNPGTAFYVGYNDDLTQHGYNRFTGALEPGFRRNGRTFFIKMSYLFRRSF